MKKNGKNMPNLWLKACRCIDNLKKAGTEALLLGDFLNISLQECTDFDIMWT